MGGCEGGGALALSLVTKTAISTAGMNSRSVNEAIANTRWLVSYTKPCPHCK